MKKLALMSVLLLAACGSDETTTKVGDMTITNNDSSGVSKIESETGSITAMEGSAANNIELPSYAPRYPGSTITGAIESSGKEKKPGMMVTFTSTDGLNKVGTFYKEKFAAEGMELKYKMISEESIMVSAEGNGKNSMVVGSVQEGVPTYVLTYSK